MPNTSPDNIYYPDTAAAQNQPAYMGTHAGSVQVALDKRQRGTYIWANATARTNQTGMAEGAEGYQLDTKTEYKYENGAWRLATAHAVFTATKQLPPDQDALVGAFTLTSNLSSSTTMVTTNGDGSLVIADPGIYAIGSTSFVNTTGGVGTAIYADLRIGSVGAIPYYRGTATYPGSQLASVSAPNVRTTASGTQIYFTFQQRSGITVPLQTEVRITRIG